MYNKRPLWQWVVLYLIVGGLVYAGLYWYYWGRHGGYNYMLRSEGKPAGATWTVKLDTQLGSNEYGEAVIVQEGQKLRVVITLVNAPRGEKQPAQIYKGACPEPDDDIKFNLEPLMDGKSETVVDTSWAQLTGVPMAISVHKSVSNRTYAVCGNIQ